MNNKEDKKNKKSALPIIIVVACVIVALVMVILFSTISIGNGGKQGAEKGGSGIASENVAINGDDMVPDYSIANSGIVAPSAENGYIGDHVRGKIDSKVLVVEYGDMQCPGCASMMTKMDAIYDEYRDKVAFVFRHYPIRSHKYARQGAAAIEAAGKQGYYWRMLSALYRRREEWSYEEKEEELYGDLATIFASITGSSADMAKFANDYNSQEVATKVSFDRVQGEKENLSATPTIIVNGKVVDFTKGGDVTKLIKDMIEEALGE